MDNLKDNIKSWVPEDRPREKYIQKGKESLSDAELMAILIGSGSKNESAVNLSRRILKDHHNSLAELSKVSIKSLVKGYKGMGDVKAITISAALELGRRRQMENVREMEYIRTSRDAYDILCNYLDYKHHEECWVLFLNRGNKVQQAELISRGGLVGTIIDIKTILKRGIELLASAMIIGHNHPSGNIKPSEADKVITKKLAEAGKLVEIKLYDHIIVGDKAFFSFLDEGML